ncbi:MAG TPA: aminotransferase class IV [Aestuariivirgaceae bacterium]|jgi:branched-chain amino acid aminotransferase
MDERVAYFNGGIVPESQVRVSFRDYGFSVGDGAFDTARSAGHKPFLFREHIDRLYKSLAYLRLDPGLSAKQMLDLTLEVFERNLPLLAEHDDYWLTQWISRGVRSLARTSAEGAPTVIIECSPLPLKARARGMQEGLEVITPGGIRRTPPEAISPRYKSLSYGNLVAGDVEVQALKPGATCVLLDTRGCLCEGLGSNIFIVRDGEVLTPHERYVLAGLSRQTVMEIAGDLSVPLREADIDLYDAYVAEEAFITSTSWCLVPVKSINGKIMSAGAWGPVTRALSEGYKQRLGGFDYVAQYTRHNI